jgi:hypothetical protein
MIISKPYGGLSNRLKCLLSTLDIDDDVKLVWDYSLYDGGVWCKFSDLFENNFEEFFFLEECQLKYPNVNIVSDCRFFGRNNFNHLDQTYGNNWGNHIDEGIKNRYFELISKLKPVKYVRDKIEKYNRLFDENTISISVRTWNDRQVTKNKKGIYFEIEKLYEYLNLYNDSKFFLTCDDQETTEKIINTYGERIIITEKRTKFGDFSSTEGLQDALVDLYLAGKNKLILSSYGSSFCELQWWFGEGKPQVLMMDLHPKFGITIP